MRSTDCSKTERDAAKTMVDFAENGQEAEVGSLRGCIIHSIGRDRVEDKIGRG